MALIGPRASGKTTLGRSLAQDFGWEFVDTDDAIAEDVGEPAGDFLARVGEPAFRVVEDQVASAALAAAGPAVVALGGGAVLCPGVAAGLGAADVFTALLLADPDVLAARLRASETHRPALTEMSADQEVSEVLKRRMSLYERLADVELHTFPANADSCKRELVARMTARR